MLLRNNVNPRPRAQKKVNYIQLFFCQVTGVHLMCQIFMNGLLTEQGQHTEQGQQRSRVNIKKIRTEAKRYIININGIPEQTDVRRAIELLHSILNDIAFNILGNIPDNDMLRLVTSSLNLDFPILIPFCLRGNFDIGRILDQVEKVVQSKFQWLLTGQFYIDLYHVQMPRGGLG